MTRINCTGQWHTLEVSFWFITVLFGMIFFLQQTSQLNNTHQQQLQEYDAQLQTNAFLDNFVKNHSTQDPRLGIAHWNPEQKRVESQKINAEDWERIRGALPLSTLPYCIQQLALHLDAASNSVFIVQRTCQEKCFEGKRITYYQDQLALLEGRICHAAGTMDKP